MSQFAAEPLPSSLDPVLAEYLDRQFNAIQLSFMAKFIAPNVTDKEKLRPLIGAIIYLKDQEDPSDNGFWGCVEDDQGEGVWKQLQVI
jgi:hypothetical protein